MQVGLGSGPVKGYHGACDESQHADATRRAIISEHLFWLSDDPFDRLKPLLPNKGRGVPRADDRKVISGIIHVIRYGLRRDAPACYGPHKTLYNRFVRWSRAGGLRPHLPSPGLRKHRHQDGHDRQHPIGGRIAPPPACSRGGFATPDRTHPGWAEFEAPRRLRWQARRTTVDGGAGQRLLRG